MYNSVNLVLALVDRCSEQVYFWLVLVYNSLNLVFALVDRYSEQVYFWLVLVYDSLNLVLALVDRYSEQAYFWLVLVYNSLNVVFVLVDGGYVLLIYSVFDVSVWYALSQKHTQAPLTVVSTLVSPNIHTDNTYIFHSRNHLKNNFPDSTLVILSVKNFDLA